MVYLCLYECVSLASEVLEVWIFFLIYSIPRCQLRSHLELTFIPAIWKSRNEKGGRVYRAPFSVKNTGFTYAFIWKESCNLTWWIHDDRFFQLMSVFTAQLTMNSNELAIFLIPECHNLRINAQLVIFHHFSNRINLNIHFFSFSALSFDILCWSNFHLNHTGFFY
jgi:hypothetical protein